MPKPTIRLGMEGYARLLSLLRTKPMTTTELQVAGNIGRTAAVNFLSSAHLLGIVHIADWQAGNRRPFRPRYLGFAGDDLPMPASRPSGRESHGNPRIAYRSVAAPEVIGFKVLLDALNEVRTRKEIIEHTGLDYRTVRRGVAALVKYKIAHLVCWTGRDFGGGAPQPNFLIGPGPNASRPPFVNATVIQRDYRTRRATRDKFKPLVNAFPPPLREAVAA